MIARMLAAATLVALACVLPVTTAAAADYVLGPEDEISISVWMHPELERKVTISADGTITFPPLGEIPASGLTPKKLADRIGDRLSTYLRQTTTVTIAVTRYMSRSIHVIGAVTLPGRYGFENIPNLLDVINAAGGAAPGADLSRVQILRRTGDGRRTLYADVGTALRAGNTLELPPLEAGDAVVVPSVGGPTGNAPGDACAVLGEVTRAGLYPAGGGINLWMLLAQAGGLGPRGDLGNVKVVSVTPEGQQVTSFNLRDVLRRGGRGMPLVRPGDVVYVPVTTASTAAKGWTAFTQALALTRDLVNIVIIADYLENR